MLPRIGPCLPLLRHTSSGRLGWGGRGRGQPPLIRLPDVLGFVKPWLAILLVVVVFVAALALWGARPGPVFSLSGVSYERSCFYNTAQGNYSFWKVHFNITNGGASASASVVISVDGTGLVHEYDFIPSGERVEVHRVLTDPSIPTDAACLQHNVTVGIGGYVF